MVVVKDGSGIHLRHKKKLYRVCNTSILNSFSHGTAVKANYKKISNCKDTNVVAIYEPSINDGWIHVEKVE